VGHVELDFGDVGDADGQKLAEAEADQPPEKTQHQRLDHELRQDGRPAGADGFAQTDLAGALGDRNEHDVHDADAADEQRDPHDAAGDHRNDQRDLVERVQEALDRIDAEIVGLAGADAARPAQEETDLGLGLVQRLGSAAGRQRDQVRVAQLVDGLEREKDLVSFLAAVAEVQLGPFLDDADDAEGVMTDADGLADAVVAETQLVAQTRLDDADLAHLHVVDGRKRAAQQDGPMLDVVVRRFDAGNLNVVGGAFAVLDGTLPDEADAAQVRDRRAMLAHALEMLGEKTVLPHGDVAHGPAIRLVRLDNDRVGPEGLDLGEDFRLQAGQRRDHGRDRRHTDHDPDRRQQRPRLVGPDLAHR